MKSPAPPRPWLSPAGWPAGLLAALVIIVAGFAAYRGSFAAPFVFDDLSAVRDNASIRQLWPLSGPLALEPQTGGSGADGRPLVNLSLAINYAIGGLDVGGYRLFNLAAHLCAALALLALVRRTLRLPACGFTEGRALATAAVVALLWTLHPLQTESLMQVQNRSEILAALCFFLTLLALVRGSTGPRPGWWYTLAVAVCLVGMACKELMVSAPLVALLYDRTFLAGTFREAWRRRWRLYLALAATWVLLALLVLSQGGRSGTAGFGLGVSAWDYLLTQCHALVIYLKLAVWPEPLVFDYGLSIIRRWTEVWPQAVLLLALAGGMAWALRRRPWLGFLGFVFFAALAPSSSVVPVVTQTMAEHRMYLPLAPLMVLAALGLAALPRAGWLLLALAALGCGLQTARRVMVYQDEITLWSDTVAKRPGSAAAHNNLGTELLDRPGRLDEAIAQFETAVRLKPGFAEAHYNLGTALLRLPDRVADAAASFRTALRLKPDSALAWHNLGNALVRAPGGRDGAIACFRAAIRLEPRFAEAHRDLGVALAGRPGGLPGAIACYETALRLRPGYAAAENSLGNALLQTPGRIEESVTHYEAALKLDPNYTEAHGNLGVALAMIPGRLPEAIRHQQRAVQLKPDYLPAHYNLALALLQAGGRETEAKEQLQIVLRLNPDFGPAREKLAELQAR